MKNKLVAALLAVSMASSLCVTSGFVGNTKMAKAAESNAQVNGESEEEFVLDHVLIKVEKGSDQNVGDALFSGLNIKSVERLDGGKTSESNGNQANEDENGGIYLLTLKDQGKQNVLDAIKVLKNKKEIKYAEPDYIVKATEFTPNDPDYDKQYAMKTISAPITWDVTTGNNYVTVGIIDSGINYNHPDLKKNIWTNPGEIPGDGIDNDGNGYVDDVHGWNFVDDTADPMDDNAHGTHCAGVIGAQGNNNEGVTGVNTNVKMAALKFLDNYGLGFTSDAVKALHYANMMKMPITSNSWGGSTDSQILNDEIAQGGLFVTAAGNNGRDIDKSPIYPACCDLDNIISVAATDKDENLAKFSNTGEKSVDIAAPGVNIWSTMPNGYGSMSGTSMATPYVAGAAALVLGFHTDYTSYDLKKAILDGADKIDSVKGKTVTGGRLNVAKAMGPVTVYKGVDYKDVYDYNYFHGAFQDVYYGHSHNPIETLQFFVAEAMSQGRPGNSTFSPRGYKDRYPDLAKKYGDDWSKYYMHYINYGKAEGRLPH